MNQQVNPHRINIRTLGCTLATTSPCHLHPYEQLYKRFYMPVNNLCWCVLNHHFLGINFLNFWVFVFCPNSEAQAFHDFLIRQGLNDPFCSLCNRISGSCAFLVHDLCGPKHWSRLWGELDRVKSVRCLDALWRVGFGRIWFFTGRERVRVLLHFEKQRDRERCVLFSKIGMEIFEEIGGREEICPLYFDQWIRCVAQMCCWEAMISFGVWIAF